jgi:hypothetical protein
VGLIVSDEARVSRRTVILGSLATVGAASLVRPSPAPAGEGPTDLQLRPDGAERQLPTHTHGFNSPANYAVPLEDPDFIPALRRLAPHYLRFPGGTVANYYNWRTGQLDVASTPNPSIYRKYLVEVAVPNSRRLHPNGVRYDDFHAVASLGGADIIFLPNLETSSVENETARLADMHSKGLVPRNIELGNEFHHGLLMDPETMRIFPDYDTALKVQRRYLEAIRPYLRPDAKIAVQAANSRLHHPESRPPDNPRAILEHKWDEALRPEPWFHAVTTHLYPGLSRSAGLGAMKDIPANADLIYRAMLARADEGFERSLAFTVSRVPGKEIWVTEWGGFEIENTFSNAGVRFSGLWLHQVTRGFLAMQRRPEVTVTNYHALFARGDLSSVLRATDGPEKYALVNSATVLNWFFEASRGPDSHYRRVHVEGSKRISADGTIPGEGFRDLEAALFRQNRKHTLFVHNAWKEPRTVDVSQLAGPGAKLSVSVIQTSDLLASLHPAAPQPQPQSPGPPLTAPPYSIVRATWIA